jgi:plastocyanin
MKSILTFTIIMLLILCQISYGQLTITEISYNPAESGTDSLEYLEVTNKTELPLRLGVFKFTKGINYTFPDTTIGPNKQFLVVKNSRAFKAVYNITAADWSPSDPLSTNNTLSNSGEQLEITDTVAGTKILAFKYEKTMPWPLPADGVDGNGKSIELCGATADPANGANWKASVNSLNFMHNNKEIFGTPGAPNTIPPCETQADFTINVSNFKFDPANISINKGQTIRWMNLGGNHNVNGRLSDFPDNPEGFYNGDPDNSSWTFDKTFNVAGFYQYNCSAHPGSMKGTITVIDPNAPSYPERSITEMTSTNAEGVLDSLNKLCALKGIVHGVNLRPAGLQFTIIDGSGNGVGVFNSGNNFNYTVKEGDEVKVIGKMGQFNGFTQLTLDGVTKIGENKPLATPKVVTSYVENDESSLLRITNVKFKDETQWTGTGGGFNVTMVNDAGDKFVLRIDNDIDAYSMPIPDPTKTYNVTGLLGQFDTSAPFDEGYQLFPRYLQDFSVISSTFDGENGPENMSLVIFPNPAMDKLVVQSEINDAQIEIYHVSGKKLLTSNQQTIDITSLPVGLYLLVSRNHKYSLTKKFAKH